MAVLCDSTCYNFACKSSGRRQFELLLLLFHTHQVSVYNEDTPGKMTSPQPNSGSGMAVGSNSSGWGQDYCKMPPSIA